MYKLTLFIFFIFTTVTSAQRSDFAHIDFTTADYKASLLEGEELYNLPLLSHKLTSTLTTDVEKFRAIYYWVTHNIKGNDALTRKSKKMYLDKSYSDAKRSVFKQEVLTTLVNDKETLCTGYAYLIKKLALLSGITCEVINGYDPTSTFKSNGKLIANHAWNSVRLDGKWYVCDATWSSGYTDVKSQLFIFDFDPSYFLMEPEEFLKKHHATNEQWNDLLVMQ